MGNPAIYWQPRGATSLQRIDLPWVTDLDPQPIRVAQDVSPIGGTPHRTDLGGYTEVMIECKGLDPNSATHAPIIRRLLSLQSHVQAGGVFGFAHDHALAAGFFTTSPISHGDTALTVQAGGSVFGSWSSSGDLSSGDEVRIADGNPDLRIHHDTFTSRSGVTVTVGDGSDFSFSAGALVVARDFYPVLFGSGEHSDGRPILTQNNRRLEYRLNLIGLEYPAAYRALYAVAEQVSTQDQPRSPGQITLDQTVTYGFMPDLDPAHEGVVRTVDIPSWSRWIK